MARTLVGTLILRLQENISQGAGKAAGALNSLGVAVDNLGKRGGGFSRLQTNAQKLEKDLSRLGSAPWGARMQSQLERLGAGSKDIERVRNEWEKLVASMNSRGLKKGAMAQEIGNWRAGVIGHFTAVRLEAEKTKRSLANIWKPMATAAGLGTGAYVFGRLGRAGLTASSEFERAKSRSYFAGLDTKEQGQLRNKAVETSQKYRLGYGNTLDTITDAALNFGSVDKALKVADSLAAAQVYLSNLFGAQGASDQLRQMTKALDTLEINDPERVRKVVDGLIRAQAVEGKEFSPEQWAQAIRYGRAASRFFSDEFLTSRLPALVAETSGSDVGTMLQSLYQGFGMGRAPVHALKAQEKYGLRTGMTFTKGGKMVKRGSLINADEFRRDPISWIYNRAIPNMKEKGLDPDDDNQLAEALGEIVGQRTQGDILMRAIRSREQYERKKKEQYPKAKGLDDAQKVAEKDPFAGWEAFKQSIGNFSTSIMEFANPAILGALSNLSTGFNSLASAIATLDISKIDSMGKAFAALGIVAGVGAGGIMAAKGFLALISAGPMLMQAATMLQAAALAQGAKGIPGAPLVAPIASGGGIWSSLLGAGGAVAGLFGLGWLMNEGFKAKKQNPAAIGLENEAAKRREQRRAADEELVNRYRTPANPPARGGFGAIVDVAPLDAAGAKAEETGAKMKAALDVKAQPSVDSSSIDSALAKAQQLLTTLGRIGTAAASAGSAVKNLGGAYSDYGVSP